jgi:hypothetical protein
MEEKNIVYGNSVLGLLFIPESRAKELVQVNQALLTAKTWGAFKQLVSEEFYNFFLVYSSFYQGPRHPTAQEIETYDLPPETLFTPNDVVMYDTFHAHPEIEMSEWMPVEIQEKYGSKSRYYAMDMNVPSGEVLNLSEEHMDEIAAALEEAGYQTRRDDDLINAAITLAFDPDDYPYIDEEEDEA